MDEILIATLRSGTPLVYAALAGVIAQRAGIWHLGLEGLMIAGACATIIGIVVTQSVLVALIIAVAVCMLGSVLLWLVVEKLKANQIIAGLGLTGLGLGGTTLAVQSIFGTQAAVSAPFGLPKIGPAFGPFASLSVLALLMPVAVIVVWIMLRRTRFGLRLTASGEHPFAARSAGVNPSMMRLAALLIGGVLCALAGAELAAGSLNIFAQNMTAGRGFMGFAAAIFGAGHPIGASCAALFFAVVGALGIRAQIVFGDRVPHDLLLALPYIATVFGIWLSARLRGGTKALTGFGELRDQ
ncbi:MAG: ABC transporter permease [Hyphomicrobiales bacterium]|nr:ABC transporter permease [Hyphomicrobiales bacterium]MCP4998899.1 ABC transporter permease [Hyphomicrobiales bacterium]